MTYKIIAYKGNFLSLEEAAYAEKQVNWQNSTLEECTVCTESFAALDLKSVLEAKKNIRVEISELSEADFSRDVLIFVGNRCAMKACEIYNLTYVSLEKEEEYRICGQLVGNKQIVLIYGGSRAGTLYGAAAFMEYHGIRFIFPGETGTYYNSKLDMSSEVEFDIAEAPSFIAREGYSEFASDSRYDLLLWMAHNKMNSVFMKTFEHPKLLHKLCLNMSGGGHTVWYEYMDINQEYPYRHKIFGGQDKPEDPHPVSPYYKGDLNRDGILSYGEAHPEWYAQINGERTLFRDYKRYQELGYATGDYICTSNEEGVSEFCKLLVDSLSEGTMKDLSCINLFALDNGNWYQCEKCKDYSMSYRQLMLAYHLDKAIKKATEEGRIARKIRITIPAYHETLPPPDRALPDDFDYDTITVTFYVIERCYVHDFNDEKCVETNKMLYDRLSQWVNGYYKGKFTIGEYYNVSSFASMPFLLTERMFHDIPFYYSIGVRRMKYMHMTASNRGVRALNDYVYAKLLWSISYEQEVLKREYYISKYGEYADKMRQIYEELERTCANCKLIKHYQYLDSKNRSLATELNKKKVTIFSYNHMKFEGRADDYQAGPSLTETVNRFETCFNEFCEFIKGKDYTIFEEDFEQLEYGLYTLKYLYYNALQSWDGDAQVGEQITYYAEKLKKITKPFEGYDVRGHLFENALKASRVVYEQ